MHRFALPLGLLALLASACSPAAPPPADPSAAPADPAADPAPDDTATAAGPGDPSSPPEAPDPATPPPDDPLGAVPPATEPAGNAARLLAAADCFPRAVAALQAEPRQGEALEAFLARGLQRLREEGPLPGSCGVLRPDGPAVPICAGGNPVVVERTEVSRDTFEGGREDVHLRYHFDCGGDVTTTTELTWSVGGD